MAVVACGGIPWPWLYDRGDRGREGDAVRRELVGRRTPVVRVCGQRGVTQRGVEVRVPTQVRSVQGERLQPLRSGRERRVFHHYAW